jgi:acetoin utilization protein AcuB
MKVRDIMRREPLTILDTDVLGNAQRTMMRFGIRHLPVLGDGRLVGLLSERDLLAARALNEGELDWWRIQVRDAMQSPLQTVSPDDSVIEIAARMAATKLDAFAVIELGKLIGLISIIDVLDAEVREAMTA